MTRSRSSLGRPGGTGGSTTQDPAPGAFARARSTPSSPRPTACCAARATAPPRRIAWRGWPASAWARSTSTSTTSRPWSARSSTRRCAPRPSASRRRSTRWRGSSAAPPSIARCGCCSRSGAARRTCCASSTPTRPELCAEPPLRHALRVQGKALADPLHRFAAAHFGDALRGGFDEGLAVAARFVHALGYALAVDAPEHLDDETIARHAVAALARRRFRVRAPLSPVAARAPCRLARRQRRRLRRRGRPRAAHARDPLRAGAGRPRSRPPPSSPPSSSSPRSAKSSPSSRDAPLPGLDPARVSAAEPAPAPGVPRLRRQLGALTARRIGVPSSRRTHPRSGLPSSSVAASRAGARGRARTCTASFRPGDFKSPASTDFATRAEGRLHAVEA